MKRVFIAFLLFLTLNSQAGNPETRLLKKAARIHRSAFTVDSHVDTPLNLMDKGFDISKDNSVQQRGSKVDFARMKTGGLDAAFFAVFISQGARTPEGNHNAEIHALRIFDSIHSVLNRYPSLAGLALSPSDGYKFEKQEKRAIFIGVENGYPVGNDIRNVKHFFDLGARYITLCHTRNNDICTSSTDTNNTEHGLSPFGNAVVAEMNRLGMMVDVSHISDKSFFDVLAVSKAPVIASHSCSRALCDNLRNLTDDMLHALAKNGGVIQMCILGDYVKTPPPNPARDSARTALREKYRNFDDLTEAEWELARADWDKMNEMYPQPLASVQDVCNHIDHLVEVAGIDHVGIGTDFDGGGGVKDCNDASQMGNITLELVKRGYNSRQIRKIWGGNLMRVMREVNEKAGS
jgi:membrane dipeptidase